MAVGSIWLNPYLTGMSLEKIFKAALLFLTLVVLFHLDIKTEERYLVLVLGMLAYTAYTCAIYRSKLRERQGGIVVLKSYNWVPALLMWFVIAAMVLKDQAGWLMYVNAVGLFAIAVLTAQREATKAYAVDHTGIQDLKSSKFIAAEEIVEMVTSEEAVTVRTKRLEDQLTIQKRKIKSPDFNQAIALLSRFPEVLKEV
jgi:hypothetical protein